MKRVFCLAVSALLGASALAETLVTTPIMGFLNLNLKQGNNFMGFALLPSMELQGAVTIGEDRKHVFFQGAQISLTNDQFNVGALASHAVEIVSEGTGLGFTSVITDTITPGNELVLESEVPAGVDSGAVVKIWKLWTLADVFGATNTANLTGGTVHTTADLIRLPNGSGFDEYFYSTAGGVQGTGWRKVDGGTVDQASVPLKLNGGFAVFARSPKSIIIVGQVKPGKTRVSLQPGNNFVANLCPVNAVGDNPSAEGRKLETSGLFSSTDGIDGGASSKQADLVLLWNSTSGGYDQYYYSTGGGLVTEGWRLIGAGNANQATVPLPDGAYIIFRRGAPKDILINQGNF